MTTRQPTDRELLRKLQQILKTQTMEVSLGRTSLGQLQEAQLFAQMIIGLDLTADRDAEGRRIYDAVVKQEHEISNTLATALGFPMGPHVEICPECDNGPCVRLDICSTQAMWGEHCAESLASMTAEVLEKVDGHALVPEPLLRVLLICFDQTTAWASPVFRHVDAESFYTDLSAALRMSPSESNVNWAELLERVK